MRAHCVSRFAGPEMDDSLSDDLTIMESDRVEELESQVSE